MKQSQLSKKAQQRIEAQDAESAVEHKDMFTDQEKETIRKHHAKKTFYQREGGIPFKTAYNSIPEEGEIKPSILPSETLDNQVMSIREITERHVLGLPIKGIVKVPLYDEEDTMPDIRKMDLVEIQAVAQEHKEIRKRIQSQETKARMEKEAKFIEEQVAKKLAEHQKQQSLQSNRPTTSTEGGDKK